MKNLQKVLYINFKVFYSVKIHSKILEINFLSATTNQAGSYIITFSKVAVEKSKHLF